LVVEVLQTVTNSLRCTHKISLASALHPDGDPSAEPPAVPAARTRATRRGLSCLAGTTPGIMEA
jgi:hypothetical protein